MAWQSFSAIFDGLEEAFGTYKIDKTQANGKKSGRAALIREPKTIGWVILAGKVIL